MLRPRIIPCLLVHNRGLVKTIGFSEPKYVGDPINVVKIFNEKRVDELAIFDIDATVNGVDPDFKLISQLAVESRMPLCYGGGVRTTEQAKAIIGLGVEKVAVSSAAVARPALLTEIAGEVGSQSVVVVLDVRKNKEQYEVWTHNGTKSAGRSAIDFAQEAQERGAGEIIVNSIDRDGRMTGYDLELSRQIKAAVNVPVTILGGAGTIEDIGALLLEAGIVGAAAGSLFVFKGPYKAVLVNYPSIEQKEALAAKAYKP